MEVASPFIPLEQLAVPCGVEVTLPKHFTRTQALARLQFLQAFFSRAFLELFMGRLWGLYPFLQQVLRIRSTHPQLVQEMVSG